MVHYMINLRTFPLIAIMDLNLNFLGIILDFWPRVTLWLLGLQQLHSIQLVNLLQNCK